MTADTPMERAARALHEISRSGIPNRPFEALETHHQSLLYERVRAVLKAIRPKYGDDWINNWIDAILKENDRG